MNLKNEHVLVYVVASLLIGAGAGYVVGQSPISRLREDIQRLETDNLDVTSQLDNLSNELSIAMDNLTTTISSLENLNTDFLELSETFKTLSDSYSELEGELEDIQRSYSELDQEHNSLELSYSAVKQDYDRLRECIPSGVGILYSELKNSSEGYITHDLIGVCGQDYLLQAPANADVWEVNITIVSELSYQPVHIRIYKIIEHYPPDWSEQPFAPYARGEGITTIQLALNTSYSYDVRISDAYAKPFTGFIEERWYPSTPEVTVIDIPGIVNGDFSLGNEGWYTQGKSSGSGGAKYLYQRYGGTYTTQEIVIGENQGVAFMLKSNGARLEVQVDGYVIYYGDSSDGTDWTRVVVPFGNVYLGPRDIYFIVMDGEDDGSYIVLDNITLVQFS